MILETRAAVAQPGMTSRRFPRPTLFGRTKSVEVAPSVVNLTPFGDLGFQRNRLRAGGFVMSGVVSGVLAGRLADVQYSKGTVFRPTVDTQSCADVVKTEFHSTKMRMSSGHR